jgi:hypothetical protein
VDIGLRGPKWNGENTMCEVMQKYEKIAAEKAAREASIQTMVKASFEFGATKEKAIESLMKNQGLSEQEALESYEKYSPAPVASM